MVTLAGNAVRLEPLAAHHPKGLFEILEKDEQAWRWMMVVISRQITDFQSVVERYIAERELGIREPIAVVERLRTRCASPLLKTSGLL